MARNTEDVTQGAGSTGMATSAKILGIISIVFALLSPIVGLLLAIIALILGIVSLKSKKRSSAVTGITTSAVAIFLALLMLVVPVMYADIQQKAEQTQLENAEQTQSEE